MTRNEPDLACRSLHTYRDPNVTFDELYSEVIYPLSYCSTFRPKKTFVTSILKPNYILVRN